MKNSFRFFRSQRLYPGWLIRITALLLAFFLCSSVIDTSYADQRTSFTLLVYMTGSDLETNGGSASQDILEMVGSLPTGSDIRILLEAGGAESWQLDIDPSKNTRIEICNGQWIKISETEKLNMAAARTLQDFLDWGYAFAPAEQYGLIIWNHGAGPLIGVCLDEQYTDPVTGRDALNMEELQEALYNSPFHQEKLSFIGFDACLMSTLEIASMMSPFAQYMIASEETEPDIGWDYGFLKNISGGDDGKTWCMQILESYRNSLISADLSGTLSCLDLGKTDIVMKELDAFFSSVTEQITIDNYPAYTRCRAYAKALGGLEYRTFDLIDLLSLISNYEEQKLTDGSALRSAINQMVFSTFAEHADFAQGLSIYYPFDNKARYISSWYSAYQQSSFSSVYRAFISRISEYYLHDSLFNMASDYQIELQEDAGSIDVEMALSEEDVSRFVRSRMQVMERLATDTYRIVYYDDQNVSAEEDDINCSYAGEALYVVDKNQNILMGPVSYFPVENGISVSGILFFGYTQYAAKLIYHKAKDGRLVLSQVLTSQGGSRENRIFLPSSLDIRNSSEMLLVSFGPCNEGEDTLTSLNFTTYFPDYAYSVDLNDPDWEFALIPGWSRNDRYVFLRLTDVQGNTVCSEAELLPALNRLDVAEPQGLESGAELETNLVSGSLVTGFDAGLMFSLSVQNKTENSLELQAVNVSLNGNVHLEPWQFQAFRYGLAPDEKDQIDFFIPLKTLQAVSLPEEITEASVVFSIKDGQLDSHECTVSFPLSLNTAIIRSITE